AAPPPGKPRGRRDRLFLAGLPVSDIADDTHCEGRIDREHFLGVDANLTLPSDHRPVDLVIVLPGFDLGNIRHFVRLVLNWQVLGPADDRPWRDPRVDPNRDSQAAVDCKGVIVKLYHSGGSYLIFAATSVCGRI